MFPISTIMHLFKKKKKTLSILALKFRWTFVFCRAAVRMEHRINTVAKEKNVIRLAATWSPLKLHESFKERGCVGEHRAVIMET